MLVFVFVTVLLVLPFRWINPPFSMYMAQEVVSEMRERGAEGVHLRFQWVSLEAIAEDMQLAVIAAEDQRFPDHWGVDVGALREALADALRGGRMRGASTITQQTAKNLYLWHGRSVVRKVLEAWLAAAMEVLWPKTRILEVYLNVAEWDAYVYGVEAASVRYYGIQARTLSREQAALLAAVLPNPHQFRVDAPDDRVRERQRWILWQMSALGGVAYLDELTPEESTEE